MRRPPQVLALALLAVASCKKPKPAPTSYTYYVFVETSAHVEGLELEGRALKIKSSTNRGTNFEVTLPASEYLVDKALQVKLTTSCGSTSFPAKADTKGDTRSSEDYERAKVVKDGDYVTADAVFTGPTMAWIYADRDGKPSSTVQVGTTTLDPKLDSTPVALGSCPTADEIKVDGVAGGSLHIKPKDAKDEPKAFIDVAGGHCYDLVEHVFVDKTWDTKNMEGGKTVRLEGQRGYVANVDDFLKPPPTEMKVKDGLGLRYEVRRCAPKPKSGAAPKPRR